MKIKIILSVLLLIPLLTIGCLGVPTSKTPAVNPQTQLDANQDKKISDMSAAVTAMNATLTSKNTEQDTAIAQLKGGSTDSYTKAQIDSKFNNMIANLTDDQIVTLKAKLGLSSSSGGGTTTPPVTTGQISYSVQNAQPYYQFTASSSFPVQIRIYNNKADSRYVRLQLTTSTMSSTNAGAATATCTVVSNSQGQSAVAFLPTATPTGAVNTVLFIANSGGVSGSGEYLLATGGQMDIYMTIIINTGNAVLWNLSVSGSDRPIS